MFPIADFINIPIHGVSREKSGTGIQPAVYSLHLVYKALCFGCAGFLVLRSHAGLRLGWRSASTPSRASSDAQTAAWRFAASSNRDVVKGRPAEKILDVAAREEIDLIVMGSRGQTAMGHVFMGSVAQRVGQNSRVPILLIPAAF